MNAQIPTLTAPRAARTRRTVSIHAVATLVAITCTLAAVSAALCLLAAESAAATWTLAITAPLGTVSAFAACPDNKKGGAK